MAENPLGALEALDPQMIRHLRDSDPLVFGDGAENGVRALAARAMQEGATTQEIAEVLRVAWHLTGAGALYTASAGLKGLV